MFAIGMNLTSSAEVTAGKGFALNDEAADHAGNIFRFGQASGAVAINDCVVLNSAGVAQAITSTLGTAGGFVGVAQTTLASAEYGWFQVLGVTSLQVLSTCSSGVALYTSGTAGKLDDTSASQVKVAGVQLVANATASGVYQAMLVTRPFIAL
jgi:hypothetical protein